MQVLSRGGSHPEAIFSPVFAASCKNSRFSCLLKKIDALFDLKKGRNESKEKKNGEKGGSYREEPTMESSALCDIT